jgi:hypothetical protein
MRFHFHALLLLSLVSASAFSQSTLPAAPPVANQYIEGARLVIDILQLFKKETPRRNALPPATRGALCNFCLFNSDSLYKIRVTLCSRNGPDGLTHTLVVGPRQQECSLQIPCGIYNCKVETPEEKIISWGDIHINEKEVVLRK